MTLPDRFPQPPRPGMALGQLAAGALLISFAAVWVPLAGVGPTVAGFYRMLIGGAVLLSVALVRGERLRADRGAWGYVGAAAILFTLDLVFWHRSILLVGPGLATILANFQVLLLAGFGVLVLREPVRWRLIAAIPMALAGLFLLVGVQWRELPPSYRAGVVFGLLTAVSYGSYLLTLRGSQARARRLEPLPNLMVICWATAALLACVALAEGESLAVPSLRSGAVLLAYGTTAQAVGWLLISRGIAGVEAGRAGLVLLLQPALTFVWDMLLFGRPTTGLDVAGAALALGAIYLGAVRREAPGGRRVG